MIKLNPSLLNISKTELPFRFNKLLRRPLEAESNESLISGHYYIETSLEINWWVIDNLSSMDKAMIEYCGEFYHVNILSFEEGVTDDNGITIMINGKIKTRIEFEVI